MENHSPWPLVGLG